MLIDTVVVEIVKLKNEAWKMNDSAVVIPAKKRARLSNPYKQRSSAASVATSSVSLASQPQFQPKLSAATDSMQPPPPLLSAYDPDKQIPFSRSPIRPPKCKPPRRHNLRAMARNTNRNHLPIVSNDRSNMTLFDHINNNRNTHNNVCNNSNIIDLSETSNDNPHHNNSMNNNNNNNSNKRGGNNKKNKSNNNTNTRKQSDCMKPSEKDCKTYHPNSIDMGLASGPAESQTVSNTSNQNVVTGVAAVQQVQAQHKTIGKRKIEPVIVKPEFKRNDGDDKTVCNNHIEIASYKL